MVPDLKHLLYEERLKEMQLTTLRENRKENKNVTRDLKDTRSNCKMEFL